MRRIYVVRENEEDGRLLDALEAAGMTTDESEFDNPACPHCGCSTMLAYTKGDIFFLVTWSRLDAEDDKAEAWYLVCSQFDCTYEEEVERVFDPMGAEIFDQQDAEMAFESYSSLTDRTPLGLLELAAYLKSALEAGPNRKLEDVLDQAEWLYDSHVERAQKWISCIPPGKRIRFSTWDDQKQAHVKVEGTFVCPTDEGLMLLRAPGDEVMLRRADEIDFWEPKRPETDEVSKTFEEVMQEDPPLGDQGSRKPQVILLHLGRDRVVVRGYHLQLREVDRFGQYHVGSEDPVAAAALDLTEAVEGYWEGVFRRSDVEAKYEARETVKVKGHWLDQWGSAGKDEWAAVQTEDPDTAAALGLEPQKPWFPPETEAQRLRYRPRWSGLVRDEEIEDRKEVRIYHWPLPDLQGA